MNCARESLPVLADRFRCDRLAGKPTLSTTDCAARWLRAQRPAADDPHRPASFATCAGCADGAARNGAAAPEPAPPRHVKEDMSQVRREVIARVVRERGQASMGDLVTACRTAGLGPGRTLRQVNRFVRHNLGPLLAEGRIRRLAKGLYGTRRATPPVSRWALALAWVDEQEAAWSPADLQAALADTLRDSTRPRQRVHKLLRRLIRAGEVERVGLGTYARSGLLESLPDPMQQLALPLPPVLGMVTSQQAEPAPTRRSSSADEPAQLAFGFAA
jgi:hypothetical protein